MGKLSIYFSWFFWRGEGRARGLLWLRTGGERKINFLSGQDGDSALIEVGLGWSAIKLAELRTALFVG